ncbi:MAG: peptidase M23 [Balneolaceae bacterium]|nr:MAG: peptidase M23 [Balneolaceae bacterium]
MKQTSWFWKGFLNSYTQIFFSDNKVFAAILIPVTFVDFFAGLFGLISVLITNSAAWLIGLSRYNIQKGYYGFNSLLVGLGIGIYYEPGLVLLFLVFIAAVFTLFISVTLEGVIGKYYLPHLSLPFVFGLWMLMLSAREFDALALNERWIYTLNDLYIFGGQSLVTVYEWWNRLSIPSPMRSYFLSLGAILFQFSVLSGVLVAAGLLIYSRIAFSLSLLGFYGAWLFYTIIGAEISEVGYSYVGFNYILTAIALGGFFIIPNIYSYLWVLLVVPMVAIVAISLGTVLGIFYLPVYALPFNIVVLIFLYVLQFRINHKSRLYTYFVQRNSPERNLYSFINFRERFAEHTKIPLKLPFYGEWTVTQGHNGEYTHKNDWRYAWDFEITDEEGKTFKNEGDYTEDYFCFNKCVTAPADGVIEDVVNDIDDNIIGEKNLEQNWGNTVIMKHSEHFYTKLSHFKKGSIQVRKGDRVREGDAIGLCGNSGNSPYPHLHFQVQTTPYIGSKTLKHAISNYFKRDNGLKELVEVGIPEKDQKVSNIQINTSLKEVFHYVPGMIMKFEVTGLKQKSACFEVKIDNNLNRYIECRESGSKAYFDTAPAMIHFVHFEGDRSSLLYYYYLSAYKISFGFEKGQTLNDTYPIHLIYHPGRIFLQDFIAPFYRYLKGSYQLNYPQKNGMIASSELNLNGTIQKQRFGHITHKMTFQFVVDGKGLKKFDFSNDHVQIQAICVQ